MFLRCKMRNYKIPRGGGGRLSNTALHFFNYLLDQLHASTCAILFLVPLKLEGGVIMVREKRRKTRKMWPRT